MEKYELIDDIIKILISQIKRYMAEKDRKLVIFPNYKVLEYLHPDLKIKNIDRDFVVFMYKGIVIGTLKYEQLVDIPIICEDNTCYYDVDAKEKCIYDTLIIEKHNKPEPNLNVLFCRHLNLYSFITTIIEQHPEEMQNLILEKIFISLQ